MCPFEDALERAGSIPRMGWRTAEDVLAEIGDSVSNFSTQPTWLLGLRSNRATIRAPASVRREKRDMATPLLGDTFVEAARGAARTRDAYLAAQYYRRAARHSAKRTILAVTQTMLFIVQSLLKNGANTDSSEELSRREAEDSDPESSYPQDRRLRVPGSAAAGLRRYFRSNFHAGL